MLIAVLAGCSDDADDLLPGQCATPIAAPATSPGKVTATPSGGLHDERGRDVVMRGINTGGRSKWAPFVPFPIDATDDIATVRKKADAFFGRLKPWGLDTVRLPFSWEALEPKKGQWDLAYLDRYAAMVDAAGALGIRVIVDFHQDVYASPFCGDGFPLWTLKDPNYGPPCRDKKEWFTNYLVAPVQDAFKRVYGNTDGLLDAFIGMWTKVATRFKDHDAVIGFEIINEPGGWTTQNIKAFKDTVLNPFHEKLVAHVRGIAPSKLVFFDNTGYDALINTPHLVRPKGEGVVYAPHFYDAGLILGQDSSGSTAEKVLPHHVTFANKEGLHMLIGEFGYGGNSKDGPSWLADTMSFVDKHRMSATLWEYSINETAWNHEDLSVVTKDGEERAVLDTYVRPWLRAVKGTSIQFQWDAAKATATASWQDGSGIADIVVPSRLFTAGPKNVNVSGGCWSFDSDAGRLRVKADEGADVQLSFSVQ